MGATMIKGVTRCVTTTKNYDFISLKTSQEEHNK